MIIDIETAGLESLKHCITCISINKQNVLTSFINEDEKIILEQFWQSIEDGECFIGFNINEFDIPFLIRRSLIHKIKCKKIGRVIDVRLLVNGFFYSYKKEEKGRLDDWCKILGLANKTEDGEKMIEYYYLKDFEKIKAHCEYDVKIVKALYERCEECGLI